MGLSLRWPQWVYSRKLNAAWGKIEEKNRLVMEIKYCPRGAFGKIDLSLLSYIAKVVIWSIVYGEGVDV